MIAADVRRPGWLERPAAAAASTVNGRSALLEALAAYRRGLREAPVVCKRGMAVRPAYHERTGSRHERRLPAAHLEPVEKRAHHEREGGGPLVFVASNGAVDRHGDTVAPEGWRLDGYLENPVVLWAHDYRQPAIGRADAVWSDGRALLARLKFAPTEFAEEVERLYRQGYQRGVSVGFRPLRFEERRDPVNGAFLGIRFLEQELLEISAVPVPANGDALLAEDTSRTPVSSTGTAPVFSQLERGQAPDARMPAVLSPVAGGLAAQAPDARTPAVDEVVGLLRGLRS